MRCVCGLTVAVLALLLTGMVSRAADEDAAVLKSVRERGGKVVLDEKGAPVEIYLNKPAFGDADLELLKRFKSLHTLNLQVSSVTNDGLKHLVGMEALKSLDVWRTRVTPAGLKHVAALKSLRTLGYNTSQITDAALRELLALNLAHKLDLASGKGGRPASLDDVEYLQLWDVNLTDAGLKELAAFKNLKTLALTGSNWTPAGLRHLAALKSLTTLHLATVTEAKQTYVALAKVLEKYADILTVSRDGKRENKAVTAVITGNCDREAITRQAVRYAAIDGRPADLDSDAPAALIPWVSASWPFKWDGTGAMPEAERAWLKEFVAKAHKRGRLVRFWASPEKVSVWKELRQAEVDLINTDRLSELQQFLNQELPSK